MIINVMFLEKNNVGKAKVLFSSRVTLGEFLCFLDLRLRIVVQYVCSSSLNMLYYLQSTHL